MSDLRKELFSHVGGCSNTNCIVRGKTSGQHTAGSCNCLVNMTRSELNLLQGRLRKALAQPHCECGLKRLTGDGCQFCNKDLHIETMEDTIKGLEAEVKSLSHHNEAQSNIRRLSDDEIEIIKAHAGTFAAFDNGIINSAQCALNQILSDRKGTMDECNIPKEGE